VSTTSEDKSKPGRLRRRAQSRPASVAVLARGEPFVWLTGGAMVLGVGMIIGLLTFLLFQGLGTFWPAPVLEVELTRGRRVLGEAWKEESYRLRENDRLALSEDERARLGEDGKARRIQLRTGNFEDSNSHFDWLGRHEILATKKPDWVLTVERQSKGLFFGTPRAFLLDGEVAAEDPEAIWALFGKHHRRVRARWAEVQRIKDEDIGVLNRKLNEARLDVRRAELAEGRHSDLYREAEGRASALLAKLMASNDGFVAAIRALEEENQRYALGFDPQAGSSERGAQPYKVIPLFDIVRAYPANRLGFTEKLDIYFDRWGEFLVDDPREANSQGGVFPAIFGTVLMTLLMTIFVVPFGVLAALYMREYASSGPVISAVRIAVNNLAGVPSIVFGVFGLGFFCYIVGGQIDLWFFGEYLPDPKFGTGGLLWASLTLALLTLPVVIVATEEALAAVPSSMRDGSYACGASKWQTVRRIVLPRAAPGIMTGAILAMARGAGEVAPLMLVGAVKLAPELAIDSQPPFLHLDRSFMHLGYHIFDLGFQSQDSEGAKPMVFTTTLLLIAIVAALNLAAIWLRGRLNRRVQGDQF
jgi:phosphate transport system permease protein